MDKQLSRLRYGIIELPDGAHNVPTVETGSRLPIPSYTNYQDQLLYFIWDALKDIAGKYTRSVGRRLLTPDKVGKK